MNKTKLFKLCKMVMSFKEYETEKGHLILDGDLAEGTEISILEDGEVVSAQDGEYEIEGKKVTVADGKITSLEEIVIEEPEVEETPAEEPEVEPTTEEPVIEEPQPNPELEEANRVIEEQRTRIAELEARIAELEAELNKPLEEPLEMRQVAQVETKAKTGALKYFE